MRAIPVIVPATNPLVAAITLVLKVGAIVGPWKKRAKIAGLAQKPTAQATALARIQVRI